ncbi:MAG: CheR family methyltransferase [Hyphomicrobiales bacterium]
MSALTEERQDPGWIAFRDQLERAIGVPLAQYKEPQLKRRLGAVMRSHGIASWDRFAAAIAADAALMARVRDTLTINVSEFFRQPDRFLDLRDVVIPGLLRERRSLRIWSAGCANGCEPYTLAMILAEADPNGSHILLATDVDMPVLARAREGRGYLPGEVRSVPPEYLRKYFVEEGGTYGVTDDVRRRVTFRRHDLLSDTYPRDMDLILCRNVVIYFTEPAKRHIYTSFANALRPGGYLFVGGSEMIVRSHAVGLRATGTSIYRRAA